MLLPKEIQYEMAGFFILSSSAPPELGVDLTKDPRKICFHAHRWKGRKLSLAAGQAPEA